jgi:hypothetical protein
MPNDVGYKISSLENFLLDALICVLHLQNVQEILRAKASSHLEVLSNPAQVDHTEIFSLLRFE